MRWFVLSSRVYKTGTEREKKAKADWKEKEWASDAPAQWVDYGDGIRIWKVDDDARRGT